MKVPWRLLTTVATVSSHNTWTVDASGQALPDTLTEVTDVPCRLEAISGDNGMVYQSKDGSLVYHGYFPSAQVMKDEYGVDDFNIGADWFITVDDVTYRVISPAVDLGEMHVLQRVMLETHNKEEAPA